MKVVINTCFGGFSLSDAAYERLIELGVPVKPYTPQKQGPTGLYEKEPLNSGEIIFDSTLTTDGYKPYHGRYWETWTRDDDQRTNPLIVQVVEELGAAASGQFSSLKVVDIPDGIDWMIDNYDGNERVVERRQSWG